MFFHKIIADFFAEFVIFPCHDLPFSVYIKGHPLRVIALLLWPCASTASMQKKVYGTDDPVVSLVLANLNKKNALLKCNLYWFVFFYWASLIVVTWYHAPDWYGQPQS